MDNNLRIDEVAGAVGFKLSGPENDDTFGISVGAGDFNGDGFVDLIVGAPGKDNAEGQSTGEAYLFLGTDAGTLPAVDLAVDGVTADITFETDEIVSSAGGTVEFVGDINGDGFGDILIGAVSTRNEADETSGRGYLIYGGAVVPSVVDLDSLDGTNGFAIRTDIGSLRLGGDGSGLGDINGDGIDDFSISGNANFLIYGDRESPGPAIDVDELSPSVGVQIPGRATWVYSVGDINDDGLGDFGFGRTAVSDGDGLLNIVYGRVDGFPDFDLAALTLDDGFEIRGAEGSRLGSSFHNVGDLNGDGIDDLAVSYRAALFSEDGFGRIIYGMSADRRAHIDLSDSADIPGFTITGTGFFDFRTAGDVNGDGIDDLLIGNQVASNDEARSAGEAYVIYGDAERISLSLDDLDASDGYRISGATLDGYRLGVSISPAGDLNADGFADIIVGSGFNSETFRSEAPQPGTAFVIYGAETGFIQGRIDGDDEANYLVDTPGPDMIAGRGGNDWIVSIGGSDQIDGGDGIDMVSFVSRTSGAGIYDTDTGHSAFFPAFGKVTMTNVERLTGTGQDDLFNVASGEIRGLGGRDLFYADGADAGRFDGGSGRDTLDYLFSTEGISASLLKGRGWSGDASGDRYTDIENLFGTNADDFIWGDHSANRLEGRHGDDTFVGNGGDDYILGGFGKDTVIYSGARADYDILENNSFSVRVSHRDGFEGTDLLAHVEILSFTDGDIVL
jgi:hypothetical protein